MKKAKRFFLFLIVIAIIFFLLALYFNWFNLGQGLGLGTGFGFGKESVKSSQETEEKGNNQTIEIAIAKENIYYQGNVNQSLSIEELKNQLNLLNNLETDFLLIDAGATLGTYEEVEKLLFEGNWKYTEKVDLNYKKAE